MKRRYKTTLFALFFSGLVHAQGLKFDFPLKGIEGRDFFIADYVDHDPTTGLMDAFCSTKTYDGHKGTDIALRSFKTMDSGVLVYAAADGRVFETHDGEFDRSTEWRSGGLGNHVGILHADSLCTYYGHLTKNSIMVHFGDSVKRGQIIGKVGSSGFSKGPHLHFEVRKNSGRVIDPFSGECQPEVSLWKVQPDNDTALYIIDKGFAPYYDNGQWLTERFLIRDTFYMMDDTTISFWAEVHGLRKGDVLKVKWYTPANTEYFVYQYVWKWDEWFNYTWPHLEMPRKKGWWTVDLYVDNKFLSSGRFYVAKRRD